MLYLVDLSHPALTIASHLQMPRRPYRRISPLPGGPSSRPDSASHPRSLIGTACYRPYVARIHNRLNRLNPENPRVYSARNPFINRKYAGKGIGVYSSSSLCSPRSANLGLHGRMYQRGGQPWERFESLDGSSSCQLW
jgi:hypothetical protein